MENLEFSIVIDAPKEVIWNTMLNLDTYKIWTEPFGAGSTYRGSWDEGSKILFTAPHPDGEMGMVSRIKENRKYEFLSIEHVGILNKGVEDTTSDAVKEWAGALENYTFKEKEGKTEVDIFMSKVNDNYVDMFKDMWPKALQKLKELAESKITA